MTKKKLVTKRDREKDTQKEKTRIQVIDQIEKFANSFAEKKKNCWKFTLKHLEVVNKAFKELLIMLADIV